MLQCQDRPVSLKSIFGLSRWSRAGRAGTADGPLSCCRIVILGERSSFRMRAWFPSNVELTFSLRFDVGGPSVSKFVALEIAPVVRTISENLVVFGWADE